MRRSVLRLVVALPLVAGALTSTLPAQTRAGGQLATPFRIIGNIYYVGLADPTSYLIVTPEGSILLNAPEVHWDRGNPRMAESITALGFRLEDVRVLLNTHEDYDHVGGLVTLKKRSGGRLMVSEPTRQLLEKESPGIVDRVIRHGDTVTLGGVTLTAHLTPGHTAGSTTWTMTVVERGKPYQVVFASSVSVPPIDGITLKEIEAFERTTFARLRALKPDVYLCDHMQMCNMVKKYARLAADTTVNPFVDSAAWPVDITALGQQIVSAKQRAAKAGTPE